MSLRIQNYLWFTRIMISINDIDQFQEEIQSCRELIIPRYANTYRHHVFVGEVNEEGCCLYHYESVCSLEHFPSQIRRAFLNFEEYKSNPSHKIRKIFDLKRAKGKNGKKEGDEVISDALSEANNTEKGDEVIINDRSDYPKSDEAKANCIKRAQRRLDEQNYSAVCNNCQSYVHWIFSGDNTSKQAENYLTKNICGNIIDGTISRGKQRQASQTPKTTLNVIEKIKEKKGNPIKNQMDFKTLIPKQSVSINTLKCMTRSANNIKSVLNSDILKINMPAKMREELGKMALPQDVFDAMKIGPSQKIFFEEFQSRAQKHCLKSVANESVKEASTLSIATTCTFGIQAIFEIGSFGKKIHDIKSDEYMTDDQKSRSYKREIGSSLCGVFGSLIGQSCIPIIGGHVGGFIGSAVGGFIGGTLVHSVF